MTPKKPRKSLDDSIASEFVYGNPEPTSQNEEPQIAPTATDKPAPASAPVEAPTKSPHRRVRSFELPDVSEWQSLFVDSAIRHYRAT